MSKQPEALRLADACQGIGECDDWPQLLDAASELRRLHAENQALNNALQYSMGCHREMSGLAVRQRARLDELESQGERKPLDVEEIHRLWDEIDGWFNFARAIEVAHGIK